MGTRRAYPFLRAPTARKPGRKPGATARRFRAARHRDLPAIARPDVGRSPAMARYCGCIQDRSAAVRFPRAAARGAREIAPASASPCRARAGAASKNFAGGQADGVRAGCPRAFAAAPPHGTGGTQKRVRFRVWKGFGGDSKGMRGTARGAVPGARGGRLRRPRDGRAGGRARRARGTGASIPPPPPACPGRPAAPRRPARAAPP